MVPTLEAVAEGADEAPHKYGQTAGNDDDLATKPIGDIGAMVDYCQQMQATANWRH